MIISIIRQYFAVCVFVLIVDSLLPKAFHILHILCGGLFTAVKAMNFHYVHPKSDFQGIFTFIMAIFLLDVFIIYYVKFLHLIIKFN